MIKATIPPANEEGFLGRYADAYQRFSWRDVEKDFTWSKTGNVNIAHEAVDRWAGDRNVRDRKGLVFEKAGKVEEFTYLDLRERSSQWANLLIECGFGVGDRLFIFLTPSPETYFVLLACARLGVIFSPLYPNLTFDELEVRLQNAKPRGIVTHPDLVERLPVHALAGVDNIFLIEGPSLKGIPGEVIVPEVISAFPKKCACRWVRGATPLYLMYTSGSTGPPKGVVHAHQDMLGHLMTAKYVLNLSAKSVLWTDGDPGWVTGTAYGAFAPWLCGATTVIQGDQF